jgi:hypothetical protein
MRDPRDRVNGPGAWPNLDKRSDVDDDIAEHWLPVVGYEGLYAVSDWGRVRSFRRSGRGQLLKPHTIPGAGYQRVTLSRPGEPRRERKYATIHQLVMLTFVGPRPEGLEVCHWDGDPANNQLSNLRYGTRSANREDARRHGTLGGGPRLHLRKTHCLRGHPYDEENTYISKNGARGCRACNREYQRERHGWSERIPPEARTHCKHGHELTPENIRINPRGSVVCRTCCRERQRKYRAAARQGATTR